ncbi:MAG: imidazoleglycerol-phosphate dehydratase HisB [Puniceicoccaceae bacterium]
MAKGRIASVERNTKETRILLELNLDGSGVAEISTGIPFFDHMLELFTHHGMVDLRLKAEGDLSVDYHHTVEDVGIVLGQAVRDALGNKAGIKRYGFFLLPMDECLSRFVMDLGNRPHLVYRVDPGQGMVRDFNIVLVREFFQAFANTAGANVHIELLYGDEPHHIAESIFKAFGRTLDICTELDPRREGQVPSTKGSLG